MAANYGDDALFKSGAANNPASLSEAELNAFRQYLPTINGDYWLSDASSKYGFDMIGVAGSDNTMLSVKHTLAGKTQNGSLFVGDDLSLGSYDIASDFSTTDFNQPSGTYLWSLSSDERERLYPWELYDYISNIDNKVYNNPYCIDDQSRGFYSSELPLRIKGIYGKVVSVDGVPTIKTLHYRESIRNGDIVVAIIVGVSTGNLKGFEYFLKSSTGVYGVFLKYKVQRVVIGIEVIHIM